MYHNYYAEVTENSAVQERANESLAIEKAIGLMKVAEECGMNSKEAIDAQLYVRQLWVYFVEDLSSPENAFPDKLKAEIISIGFWFLRQLEEIRHGEVNSFSDMIEVLQVIRDGLK